MANAGQNKKIVRTLLWIAVLILSGVSMYLLLFNYRTLEKATLFSETSAVDQSKNYVHYVGEYKTTKIALDETNQMLLALTQELQLANNELSSTRNELGSVQQLNDALRSSIGQLERYKVKALERGEALEAMIQSFKKKNKELDMELQNVRKELALYQPDITDLNEGRVKVKRFKNQIHLVKKNMGVLKQKAQEVKVAAQKERDRLESLYGNAGYLVKDGQDRSVTQMDQKVGQVNVQYVNP